jgi:WD40 repeat protein
MSILVSCACGKSYPIKEQFAGKKVQCPGCNRVLTVPSGAMAPPPPLPPGRNTPSKGVATLPRKSAARPVGAEEEVVDLPMSEDGIVELPLGGGDEVLDVVAPGDDDSDYQPGRRGNGMLIGILVGVFVLLLGGGGLAIWLMNRDDDTAVADSSSSSSDKDKDKDKDKDGKPKDGKGKDGKTKDSGLKDGKSKDFNPKDRDPFGKDGDPFGKDVTKDRDKDRIKDRDPFKPPDDPPKPVEKPPPSTGPWQGHTARILAVGVTRDGRAVSAAGGDVKRDGNLAYAVDTSVRVWNGTDGKQLQMVEPFSKGISMAAIDPTGRYVVIANIVRPQDEPLAGPNGWNDLRLFDLNTRAEVRQFRGLDRVATCAAFTSDGRRLLAGSYDAKLHIWDVDTGASVGTLDGHQNPIYGVAVSADGRVALTGSSDKSVRLWDLLDKKALKVLGKHQDVVQCVAVSPDGKFGASGGGGDFDGSAGARDYAIRIWNLSTMTEARRLTPTHTDQVNALAFSADGRRLLSASKDGTVRLWHVASGKLLGTFDEHRKSGGDSELVSVAFFPDGKRSISGGYDKTLRLWTLPPDVSDLARQLKDPNLKDRVDVVRQLADYGPEAKDSVGDLLRLLNDRDPVLQREAMTSLSKIGAAGREHLDLLLPLLKNADNQENRQFALDALTTMGADALPALNDLLPLLKDNNKVTRVKVVNLVAAIGKEAKATAFTPMLELLRDPEADVAKAAADGLAKLGPPTRDQLPTLTKFLGDEAEAVRRYAVVAVTDLGDQGTDALPTVMTMLEKDASAPLRLLALEAVSKMQKDDKAMVLVATKTLNDTDPKVSLRAAEIIAAKPAEANTLPALIKAMERDDPAVQKVADEALEKFMFAPQHVKTLNDGLKSKKAPVRARIIKALTDLKDGAADAVPGLMDVVKSSTGEEQAQAVAALGEIGPKAKAAGSVLLPLLKTPDRKAKLTICQVLGKIEADEAKQATPVLVAMMKLPKLADEDAVKNARQELEITVDALAKIGPDAVPALMKAIETEFAHLNGPEAIVRKDARMTAIEAIRRINQESKMPIRGPLLLMTKLQRKGEEPYEDVRALAEKTYRELQIKK